MSDPTNDTEQTPRHFGGSDEVPEDEYAQHQREQREAEQKARMDAAHEAAKAKRPTLVYCKHMDMDIHPGTCAMCTPPEPERLTGHLMARTEAQYETGCDACDKRIKVGQEIALVDGVWVHIEHWEGP